MKRSFLNIVIDASSLVVFMSMISTGLIMRFILPPGSGRVEMLMKGGGRFEKTIDVFMGLTRHEWGQIHFYISLLFLIFLITHLYLHWNWIKVVSFGTKDHPQPLKRKIIAVWIVTFIIFSLIFPWIGEKQTLTRSEFLKLKELK